MTSEQIEATLALMGYRRVGAGVMKFVEPGPANAIRKYVYIDHGRDTPRHCFGNDSEWCDPQVVDYPDLQRTLAKARYYDNDGIADDA